MLINVPRYYKVIACLLWIVILLFYSITIVSGDEDNEDDEDEEGCKWYFKSCAKEYLSRLFNYQTCKIIGEGINPKNGRRCHLKDTEIFYDSHLDIDPKYSGYCHPRKCTVIPAWCSWSSWTEKNPLLTCGPGSKSRIRTRARCCHPFHQRQVLPCHKFDVASQTQKTGPEYECDNGISTTEEKVESVNSLILIVAIAVSGVILIIIVIGSVCFLRYRFQLRQRTRYNQRRRRPVSEAARRALMLSRPTDTVESRLVEPSAPPPQTNLSGSQSRIDNEQPPSYEETQLNISSDAGDLPPQYEAAIKYAV